VVEQGSDLASELWKTPRASVYSSILSVPESQAAVARARRGGRLDDDGLDRALHLLDEVLGEINFISVDIALAETAGALAVEFGLRGFDAVHLAAALGLRTADPLFVAWDSELNDAAQQAGMPTAID
jgi:predicted nucleic acid-binding protein